MSYPLNMGLVQDYAKYMSKKYDARIRVKGDSEIMHVVGVLLQLMRIQKYKEFMKSFATTLVPPFVAKPTIYLPYKVGSTKRPLIQQVETIAHECHHVLQWRKAPVRFSRDYIFRLAERARLEGRAYSVTMEMHWFLTDEILNPNQVARVLYRYGCKRKHVRTTAEQLSLTARTLEFGGVSNSVAKTSIAWFKRQRKV
ncbi:MAG: hypothetical protein ACYTBJ_00490 [Planctomycetota bacterium]|jgi:hypothetical protein